MTPVAIKMSHDNKIALVAHDNKKRDLVEWATFNRDLLSHHEIYATGTTGAMLERLLDIEVHKLESGPLGGDQQIGARIASREIDFLIFFWDPLEPQPHDPDVKALLRMAVVWPCVLKTAGLVLDNVDVAVRIDRKVVRAVKRAARRHASRHVHRRLAGKELHHVGGKVDREHLVVGRGGDEKDLLLVHGGPPPLNGRLLNNICEYGSGPRATRFDRISAERCIGTRFQSDDGSMKVC
jgi:methylglyoxal synthase